MDFYPIDPAGPTLHLPVNPGEEVPNGEELAEKAARGQKLMQPKAYSYIRFSTPEQEKGDSLRRQTELSEKYAREHGLVLDDTLRLTDKGLSAYRGIHRHKGALGEFLRLVEAGEIPKGSVLLVENLDRLSREQVLEALNQFTNIIQAGVKIVTLHDGIEYCQESIKQNWTQLIISIAIMARAHEESQTKARRLSAVWENKRKNADKEKLTAKAPAWVRLSEDGTRFILIPERAKAIELIFRKKLEGKGVGTIARELNQDPNVWKPDRIGLRKTAGWRESYINKILRNREVIGEYQPHKIVNGKRVAVGDPIPDYFPPAINEDLFYQVQAVLRANAEKNGNGGGRTGKARNLFTHLVKCGLCGYPMHFIDKGKPPKGGQYLHCDASRRKVNGCAAKPVRYDEFERLFFENFEELDISSLLPKNDELQAQIDDLERRLTANKEKEAEVGERIENLSDAIATTKDKRVREKLEQKLSQAFDEKDRLLKEGKKLEQGIAECRRQKDELQNEVNKTQEVYQILQSVRSEEETIALRLRLRQQIRRLIEWIKIYPLQEPYVPVQETEEPGIIKVMHSRYIDKVRIRFKGGNLRVLYLKNYAELRE